MFSYDKSTNVLTAEHYHNEPINLDIMKDQLDSYDKYIHETIYKDLVYLQDTLNKRFSDNKIRVVGRVGDLVTRRYATRAVNKQPDQYYPVYVNFYSAITGAPIGDSNILLMKIPYMDKMCKLNIDGSILTLRIEQKASTGISFDAKKLEMTLSGAEKSYKFRIARGISMQLFRRYVNMENIVRAYAFKNHIDLDMAEYFSNSKIIDILDNSVNLSVEAQSVKMASTAGFDRIDQFSLGRARDALNETLSLNAAIGCKLSRSVLGYEIGTVVDELIVKDCIKHGINELYVLDIPYIASYYTDMPVVIDLIPKGTTNCEYLKERFPKFKKYRYIPEDIDLSSEPIQIGNQKEPLRGEEIELLYYIGTKEIRCKRTKVTSTDIVAVDGLKTYKFEREVVGNYTARLRDLVDEVPEGRSADEWVYYYSGDPNVPVDISKKDMDKLTTHDLLAIMSLLARIQKTGENTLLDKDDDYLKRVNLVGDSFSAYFRRTVNTALLKKYALISSFLKLRNHSSPFYEFTREWIKSMRDGRLLEEADTLNVISEISQVNKVTTIIKDKNNAPEEVRSIAIPYYGRLCPYETPAGAKLGVVNTKAVGARVIDGRLCAPYRKIIKTAKGIRIAKGDPTYLTSEEERLYKIADVLSLEWDKDGNIKNTRVEAKLQTPTLDGETTTFAKINAFDLDYVTAFTEQQLSPTAMLIPFASSDNAVRISYGLNMHRQAIYLHNTQVPSVLTSFHTKLFDYAPSFVIKAEDDGVVLEINLGSIVVQYDNSSEETEISVPETRITRLSVVFLNYKKNVNERFKKGDILADSTASRDGYFAPARNAFVAYVPSGYNYEDAIDLTESASVDYTSIGLSSVSQDIENSDSKRVIWDTVNKFRYIGENSVAAVLNVEDSKTHTITSLKTIKTQTASGILFSVERTEKDRRTSNFKCNMINFKKLRTGDKMAGRHGNKGVDSRVRKNSETYIMKNGIPIDIVFNPHGVPSRMNMGQIYEAHAGLCAYILNIHVNSDPFNGMDRSEVKRLMVYCYELANADNIEKDRKVFDSIVSKYKDLPDSLHEHAWENIEHIVEWRGVFNKDGDAMLWNPNTGEYLEYPVTIGYVTVFKLEQQVDEKLHARSGALSEGYSQMTAQPPKGSSRKGGQKCGEMELVDYAAYGATAILHEMENEKSDNIGARTNMTLEVIGDDHRIEEEFCQPRSRELLQYNMEVLGTQIDTTEEPALPDLDKYYASDKYTINLARRIATRDSHKKEKSIDEIDKQLGGE